MKLTTLLAVAAAGTCAWSTGAFAGGTHHSAWMNPGMSVEVQTPSSVDESAPWLTGQPHLGGWTSESLAMAPAPERDLYSDASFGTGASSSASGSGSVGSDALAASETTEDRLIGAASSESGTGTSASEGASGSVGFDSSLSARDDSFAASSSGDEATIHTSSGEAIVDSGFEDTTLLSEVYLVPGPLSSFEESDAFVLSIAPTAQDIALLESLKEDFYIVTPAYDIA